MGDVIEVEARDEDNRDEDDIPTPVTVRLRVTRRDGHRVDRLILEVVPREDADEDEGRDKAKDRDKSDEADEADGDGGSHDKEAADA